MKKWTDDLPTAPGVYWFREGPAANRPQIIEIIGGMTPGTFNVLTIGAGELEQLEHFADVSPGKAQFSGPIVPPL